MEIYTVGHSNLSIEAFISLLQRHGITAVADVRSHPYSRRMPHFNQSALKSALLGAGIRYVFLGRELGARPNDLSCYVNGKALYERIAATELFSQGIQRLVKGAENYRIAMMCAEKDPLTCHRSILICQHLRHFEVEINHILSNGELESHKQLEDRLLYLYGLNDSKVDEPKQLLLFDVELPEKHAEKKTLEERIKDAYHLQGDKIAYVDKNPNNNENAD